MTPGNRSESTMQLVLNFCALRTLAQKDDRRTVPLSSFLFFDFFFFQDGVGDFADEGLGEFFAVFEFVGHGVVSDVLAAVFFDVFLHCGGGLDAVFQHYEGFDFLHFVFVGDADDCAHEDVLVGVDDVLQLGWVNGIAGGYDHPLQALLEVDESFLVHDSQVAGV